MVYNLDMKIIKYLFSRITLIILAAVLEVIILVILYNYLMNLAGWIEIALHVLSIIIAITMINNSRHLSSDMLWILLVVIFPVPGTCIYLLLFSNLFTSRMYRKIVRETDTASVYYKQDPEVMEKLNEEDPDLDGQFHYISSSAGFPFYENTSFAYYKCGEEGYPVMLAELKKAEKFIFLEYFIIEEGVMWNGIHEILKQKAEEGLDVRVIYDDMGSISTIPVSYARKLEKEGIHCIRFNVINPLLNAVMNHRDHRKILVIDGKTAFSGGINLADEYINVKKRFGYWKDNCYRVKGKAVWYYTVMFLTTWNAIRPADKDYTVFKAEIKETEKKDGYIAPYAETPLDGETVGQNIYMNVLNSANDYVYIFTPYLIIDTDLENALILTAKKGVDVRIITPGIPDKKIVWNITRSFYRNLIAGGVKIYEYTPGFDHAKVFVSDDRIATVGTLNLDYRSLYLHFENGTYLYKCHEISDIKADFLDACSKSRCIRLDEIHENVFHRMLTGFLKLFASEM